MDIYNVNGAVNAALKFLHLDLSGLNLAYNEDTTLAGLKINRKGNDISIAFSQKAYLFRALGLLKERIDDGDFSYCERSKFKMNGIMLDCSRNAVPKVSTVKNMILKLALMGHNTIMLYTEDTYEVESQPYFGYFRGRYTIAELQDIDKYAKEFGIELIPCIQTLGHLEKVLKWNGVYNDISDTKDVLMVGEKGTYKFIEDIIATCRKAFSSKRIHIGLDETISMCRGKYYDKNGKSDLDTVFMEHLSTVTEICEKYSFRPMMWGDMPFRLAGCSNYTDGVQSVNITKIDKTLQSRVDFIYWDYYSTTIDRYEELISTHKSMADNVIFAGGAWRWSNFGARNGFSLGISRLALSSCVKHGITEVFTTLWGDDGSEASHFSSWPTVQLFAEFGFCDNVNDEYLAKRFKTCTKGVLDAFLQIDMINNPCKEKSVNENFAKVLLYQDPLLGLFDYYVKSGFNEHYTECAEKMRACANDCPEYGYIFASLAALCDVLADKSELGIRLKTAYDSGDKNMLKEIANTVFPRLIANTKNFRKCFAAMWSTESKMFGFEVMDIRLGGLISRFESAHERIMDYVNGTVQDIEELAAERLPFNNSEIPNGWAWQQITTASQH